MEIKTKREMFSNKLDYFFASMSYAFGLGNVWRFPYLVYRHDGGSFLIPYFICLILIGIPFLFLESCLGQYSRHGSMTVWKIVPLFKGIGISMIVMNAYTSIYYNNIVAWSVYYIYSSYTNLPVLPWNSCDNNWNSPQCEIISEDRNKSYISPAEEYFHNHVLNKSSGIDEIGHLSPHLVICLAIAWILIFLSIFRGVKGLGEVAYFTALFPIIMISTILFWGCAHVEVFSGIVEYITPKWDRIITLDIWLDAATQIFYSLSICRGSWITLASYNPFKNNCYRDSILIAIVNSFTSICAGVAIYSILKFMPEGIEHEVNDKYVDEGIGLAFIVFPSFFSTLPTPPFWTALFFLMILTLSFGTELIFVETIVMSIIDQFPDNLRHRKILVQLCVCTLMFAAGLFMCTQSGIFIVHLMEVYSNGYPSLLIGLLELIAVSWIYGINKFMRNIREMLGFYPFPLIYWKVMFKYVCPIIILLILILQVTFFKSTTYDDYPYPLYWEIIGGILFMSSLIFIPIFGLLKYIITN